MLSKTLFFAGLATATPALFSEDTRSQRFMFDSFVREQGKQYASKDEIQARFLTFVQNLKVADERNQAELKNNVSEMCFPFHLTLP